MLSVPIVLIDQSTSVDKDTDFFRLGFLMTSSLRVGVGFLGGKKKPRLSCLGLRWSDRKVAATFNAMGSKTCD